MIDTAPPASDPQPAHAMSSPLLAVRSMVGRPVRGRDGLKGRLRDISYDAGSGELLYALIGIGGLFGFGERLLAISWSLLRFEARWQIFTAPLNAADVQRSRRVTSEDLRALGLAKRHWLTCRLARPHDSWRPMY